MFAKRDKFIRDHERVQDDGLTRCFPGRVADRTRKWSNSQARLIENFEPRSEGDYNQLCVVTNVLHHYAPRAPLFL